MGYFCLPNGDKKEDLIEHIRCTLDLYEKTDGSYDHLIEMAQTSIIDLLKISKKLKLDLDNKNLKDKIEMEKKNHCINCKFLEKESKSTFSCSASNEKDIGIQLQSKEECELFINKHLIT